MSLPSRRLACTVLLLVVPLQVALFGGGLQWTAQSQAKFDSQWTAQSQAKFDSLERRISALESSSAPLYTGVQCGPVAAARFSKPAIACVCGGHMEYCSPAGWCGDSPAHREGESQWHCPTAPLTPPPPSDAGTICPETEAHYKAPVARNICPGSGKWDDEGAMWYPSTTNSSGWRGACSSEVPATTTAQRPPRILFLGDSTMIRLWRNLIAYPRDCPLRGAREAYVSADAQTNRSNSWLDYLRLEQPAPISRLQDELPTTLEVHYGASSKPGANISNPMGSGETMSIRLCVSRAPTLTHYQPASQTKWQQLCAYNASSTSLPTLYT